MQFIRIHRRAGTLAAIALAASAISASAASARALEGPLHQAGQAGVTVSPILPPAQPSHLRATGAPTGRVLPDNVPAIARHSDTNLKAAPTVSVPVPKIGTPSDSFHWGDAAIGAGIAVAIVLLVTAGTLAIRRRTQLGEA
jgi:hypothetical protein